MDFKSKEFKDLESLWYSKLKKSGFTEIEKENGQLRTNESTDFYHKSIGREDFIRVKREYYYKATHFATNYKFSKPVHKIIWMHHSEGVSFRDISALLQTKYQVQLGKTAIANLVKKLMNIMHRGYK